MESQTAISQIVPQVPVTDDEQWTTIIRPRNGWFDIDLGELWRYRDLIRLFVRRDFVAQYKQTILGPLWFVIQPLFTTLVFTIIFGRVAKIPTDGAPAFLFFLAGTVCWSYFSLCLTQTADTFVTNAHIFGKVYFPRLVIPISIVISNLLKWLIQFGLFLGFLFYFMLKSGPITVSAWALVTPLLLIQMGLLSLGCGILVSSMTTRYQDLRHVVAFGAQLWMYATPIVYPLSQIPEGYRLWFLLNPMTAIVESFRYAFLGTSAVTLNYVLISVGITALLVFLGIVSFSRVEKTFVDTV